MTDNLHGTMDHDPATHEGQLWLGAQEVFEMMVGTTLTHSSELQLIGVQFTAMVGIAGPLCGLLSIHCGKRAASLIASRMLGAPLRMPVRKRGTPWAKSATWWQAVSKPSWEKRGKVACSPSLPWSRAAITGCAQSPRARSLSCACNSTTNRSGSGCNARLMRG